MIAIYRSIFKYRALISFMVAQRFKSDVFKTLLGHAWYFIQPFAQILIYYFLVVIVFSKGADAQYSFLLIMAGVSHFLFLQYSVAQGCDALVSNENILMQVKIEPAVFVAVHFDRAVQNTFIALFILAVFYAFSGMASERLIYYPLIFLALIILGWTLTLYCAVLSVFFRDLKPSSDIVFRVLMYLSPVIYATSWIPAKYQAIFLLNPLAVLFGLIQWALLGEPRPPAWSVNYLAVFLILNWFAAHRIYEKLTPKLTKVF